jgi:hypothetical protein
MSFARNDNLTRHLKSVHREVQDDDAMFSPPAKFTFHHPFTAILAGPSSSGKTTLLKNILQRKDSLIAPPPAAIVWYYKRWQPDYDKLISTIAGIEFIEGMPASPTYCEKPTLLILDDLMADASQSDAVCNLFIEGSHHLNISVFYLMQNAFYKSKHNRSIQINASYLILFKNPRNNIQPAILARDMFPTRWRDFMRKYHEATSKPYGYLLIDFKQETPDNQRVVTDIIPKDSVVPIVDSQQRVQERVQPTSLPPDMTGYGAETIIPWISLKRL